MLLVERQPNTTAPAAGAANRLRLRICAGAADQPLIDLPGDKATVGSSPRCDLRLQQPGVQPLHCLILYQGNQWTVRRWAAGTRLNDQPFDEAPLAPGDRLAVGSVELVVEDVVSAAAMASQFEAGPAPVTEPSTIEPASSQEVPSNLDSWTDWNSARITQLSDERQNDAFQTPDEAVGAASPPEAQLDEMWGEREEEQEPKSVLTAVHEQLLFIEEQLSSWNEAREEWQRERAEWQAEHDFVEQQWAEIERQLANLQWRAANLVGRVERLEKNAVPAPPTQEFASPAVGEHLLETPTELFQDKVDARDESSHASTPVEWPTFPQADSEDPSRDPATPQLESVPQLHTDSSSGVDTLRGTESAAQTEDELAPFAEFSIWSQGAAQDSDAEIEAADVAAMSESAPTPTVQEPGAVFGMSDPGDFQGGPAKSFIERYAHMFVDEGEVEATPPASTPEQTVVAADQNECDSINRKPRNLAQNLPTVEAKPAEAKPVEADEEESIEQYMSKLMQRVRGDRPTVGASPSVGVLPSAFSSMPSVGVRPERAASAAAVGTGTPPVGTPSDPHGGVGKGDWLTTSLGTVRRKAQIVEQPADLATLRALANETARRAISTHGLRVHRRNAITKVIVSTLAGMTSLWLMLDAPHWRNLQFITACVSLIVAAYWAGQTYAELIETFRAAAYDGPEDALQGFAGPPPALPSDGENPPKS